jgi:hypothetical protein
MAARPRAEPLRSTRSMLSAVSHIPHPSHLAASARGSVPRAPSPRRQPIAATFSAVKPRPVSINFWRKRGAGGGRENRDRGGGGRSALQNFSPSPQQDMQPIRPARYRVAAEMTFVTGTLYRRADVVSACDWPKGGLSPLVFLATVERLSGFPSGAAQFRTRPVFAGLPATLQQPAPAQPPSTRPDSVNSICRAVVGRTRPLSTMGSRDSVSTWCRSTASSLP